MQSAVRLLMYLRRVVLQRRIDARDAANRLADRTMLAFANDHRRCRRSLHDHHHLAQPQKYDEPSADMTTSACGARKRNARHQGRVVALYNSHSHTFTRLVLQIHTHPRLSSLQWLTAYDPCHSSVQMLLLDTSALQRMIPSTDWTTINDNLVRRLEVHRSSAIRLSRKEHATQPGRRLTQLVMALPVVDIPRRQHRRLTRFVVKAVIQSLRVVPLEVPGEYTVMLEMVVDAILRSHIVLELQRHVRRKLAQRLLCCSAVFWLSASLNDRRQLALSYLSRYRTQLLESDVELILQRFYHWAVVNHPLSDAATHAYARHFRRTRRHYLRMPSLFATMRAISVNALAIEKFQTLSPISSPTTTESVENYILHMHLVQLSFRFRQHRLPRNVSSGLGPTRAVYYDKTTQTVVTLGCWSRLCFYVRQIYPVYFWCHALTFQRVWEDRIMLGLLNVPHDVREYVAQLRQSQAISKLQELDMSEIEIHDSWANDPALCPLGLLVCCFEDTRVEHGHFTFRSQWNTRLHAVSKPTWETKVLPCFQFALARSPRSPRVWLLVALIAHYIQPTNAVLAHRLYHHSLALAASDKRVTDVVHYAFWRFYGSLWRQLRRRYLPQLTSAVNFHNKIKAQDTTPIERALMVHALHGDVATASAMYMTILSNQPRDSVQLQDHTHGVECTPARNDPKRAKQLYKEALTVSKHHVVSCCYALFLLAVCQPPRLHSTREAATRIAEAKRASPTWQADFAVAHHCFFRYALVAHPSESWAWLNYALLMECIYEDAEVADHMYRRGLALEEEIKARRQTRNPVAMYRAVLDATPKHPHASWCLGLALLSLGRHDEALPLLHPKKPPNRGLLSAASATFRSLSPLSIAAASDRGRQFHRRGTTTSGSSSPTIPAVRRVRGGGDPSRPPSTTRPSPIHTPPKLSKASAHIALVFQFQAVRRPMDPTSLLQFALVLQHDPHRPDAFLAVARFFMQRAVRCAQADDSFPSTHLSTMVLK
ncbi:hypothetical protein DYB37_000844 [Aphanomyces astaci]|uniref:Uncharacterized protein n=1 Tax=Aphanomyces astaci TaxID=112090 RepID=A0A418EYU4_APHAT|nr:hypothetical protein DYB37_000844 [Aphanomyces astaci]